MSDVVVNGVDLELLRQHVKEGYNASSATVLELIRIALAEPALLEELARVKKELIKVSEERNAAGYALDQLTRRMARIVGARIAKNNDAVISVVDDFIEKYVVVETTAAVDKEKVH